MTYSNGESLRGRPTERVQTPCGTQQSATNPVPANVQQLKERREYGLDNTLSQTFPCSDPLSSIPNPTTANNAEGGVEP